MIETCRICLRSDDFIVNDIQDYVEIIKKLAQIELILTEEYPSKVCQDCTTDLLNAELLREMLLECNSVVLRDENKNEETLEILEEEEEALYDFDESEINYESVVEDTHIECDEIKINPPRKKRKKQEEVKVVLRDKKPIQSSSLRVWETDSRPPVKEIDASLQKKMHYYECHYCNKPETNLENHIRDHHPDEPLVFQCRFCDHALYQKFSSLKDHVYKTHKLSKNIPCDECGMTFSLPCNLKNHKIKMHSEERNYACNFCTATFKMKSNLSVHMRVHSEQKRYKCEFCVKAYSHYSDWKTHHMTHTGEWRYFCEYCRKGFYKPSTLKTHLKSHL